MAWFDDFFQNISQNTRKSSSFNLDDFEKELKKMDENIKQASDLNDFLKNSFDTPEARQAWENLKIEEKKAKNSTDEEKKPTIEIRYPKNKDSKTYGFAWVAGMADLKEELKENFIKPLKFKFLVQNMEKQENKDEKSLELYKTLQEAFEKFKVGIPTWMLF